MKCHSSDINKIGKQKEAMSKKIADAELQKQQLEHDIKNSGDNSTEASKKVIPGFVLNFFVITLFIFI